MAEFFGADPSYHIVIFTANTTHATNKAARTLRLSKEDIVLVSRMEHSSNDLPWRQWATLERYEVNPDTRINLSSIAYKLRKYNKRVKLVAVTGASNVTGYIPPYHDIAEMAHEYGARIFVDCSQLAPHRKINMLLGGDPRHLDFIAFSAHKMQAPFGSGALIGPKDIFTPEDIPSDEPGGGTTDILTEKRAYWTAPPARFESGTPNAVGAIALATTLKLLGRYGMDNVAAHERRLWIRAAKSLSKIDGVTLYVDPDDPRDKTPILPFNCERYNHGLVAAALGFEYGIGVRHGRHCADGLVRFLLGLSEEDEKKVVKQVTEHGKAIEIYGIVRSSIGICNIDEDIDRLIEAVERIAKDGPQFEYVPEFYNAVAPEHGLKQTGEYWPKGLELEDLLSNAGPPDSLMSLRQPIFHDI